MRITLLLGLFACQTSEVTKAIETVDNSEVEMVTQLPADIEQQVNELALLEDERVWDRIPWESGIESARLVSKQNDRPIFLFSMHGELDSRC